MTTICPNCKREDTMNYDATWGVCNACGWRGNPSAFGFDYAELDKMDAEDDEPLNVEPTFFDNSTETKEVVEKLEKSRNKGERLHTMYEDENGNIVVGDDW